MLGDLLFVLHPWLLIPEVPFNLFKNAAVNIVCRTVPHQESIRLVEDIRARVATVHQEGGAFLPDAMTKQYRVRGARYEPKQK